MISDNKQPDTWKVLRNLKKKGVAPHTIIDCGAYDGQWALTFKKIFPRSKILMIEANPDEEKNLQKIKSRHPATMDYAIALLGEYSNRRATFYQMGTGSSIFEEQSNIPRKALTLTTKTLDEVVSEKKIHGVDFVKLDVQGYELEVLKGAGQTLKNVEIILMEAAFLEYNKGAPLVSDVVYFMNDLGFIIYDIGTIFRWSEDSALLQADLIFVKRDSPLRFRFFNYATVS